MHSLIARLRRLFQRQPPKIERGDLIRWFLQAPPAERQALLIVLTDLQADPAYEKSLRRLL